MCFQVLGAFFAFLKQECTLLENQLAKTKQQGQCKHPIAPSLASQYWQLLQNLHHQHLKNYGKSNDYQEQFIFMYSFKYVPVLQLSRTEFVKYLAEDKGVEDDGILDPFIHTEDGYTFKL